ncbi:hypothetical protein YC2023_095082 [Brassica napus]
METLASVIIPRKNHSPKTLTATKENSITEKINPQNNHMITTEISEDKTEIRMEVESSKAVIELHVEEAETNSSSQEMQKNSCY